MSRIGKKPVAIPKGVTVKVDGNKALGERLINRVAGEQNDLAGVE